MRCTRPVPDPESFEYFAQPEWKPPLCKLAAVAAASRLHEDDSDSQEVMEAHDVIKDMAPAVAGASGAPTRAPKFKFHFAGNESIHFYWGVERMTSEDLGRTKLGPFNLEFIEKEFQVLTIGGGASGVDNMAATVTVPLITNSSIIMKGERLILQIDKKEKIVHDTDPSVGNGP